MHYKILSCFPLNCFMSAGVFRDKVSGYSNLKMLSSKQMLKRLQIVLAQVKAGNTPENLLNETRQIIYSLNRAK